MSQYFFHWTLSLGTTAATSLALGLFVLLHTNGRPLGRLFALWCLSVMWWSGGELLMITHSTGEDTVFWGRVLQAGDIFLPTLFLHFVGMLVGRPLRRSALTTLYATATALAVIISVTPWVITHQYKNHLLSAYFEIPGPLYLPMMTFFLAQCVIAMFLLFRAYRDAQGQLRLRYGYYLTGTVVGYVGGCMNFLPVYGLDRIPALYAYGTYGVLIYVGITAYSIVRHRLFDISIVLPKGLASGLLVTSITLIAAFFGILVSHRLTLTLSPLLIVGLVVFIIGIRMLWRHQESSPHVRMGILCWIVSLWLLTLFMMQSSQEAKDALWWHHLAWIAMAFVPSCAYHFAATMGSPRRHDRLLVLTMYLTSVGFAASDMSHYFDNDLYTYPSGIAPKATLFFPAYLAYFLIAGLFALQRLYSEYRSRLDAHAPDTSQSHAIFWGVALGGLGALDAFRYYGVDSYPLGLFGIILWICLVTPALSSTSVEHHFLKRFWAARDLSAEIVAVLLCYLVIFGAIRAATGVWAFIASGILVAITGLFASAMLNIRRTLERRLLRHLFPQHDAGRDAMMSSMKDMLSTLSLRTVKSNILHNVATVMRTQEVSLFLLNAEKTEYLLAAALNSDQRTHETISPQSIFAEYLHQSQAIISKEQLAYHLSGRDGSHHAILLDTLYKIQAELCCPINTNNQLVGFLVLGARDDSTSYSYDDLLVLSTLVQTAAIALVNAQLYEDLKRSELLASQSKHLRSLLTMAGGFAHEIRNPLTSIKTFLQLIAKRKDDPEFMHRFIKTVNGDIARIERLIKEIFNCSKYMNPLLREDNINAIVTSCLHYAQLKAEAHGIRVHSDLSDDLPPVWMDAQQMTQVLINVLLNAIEAMMPGPGSLLIQTHRLAKERNVWIQIEVTDTGCGIKPEDLDHIFDPFFTTKHNRQEWEGTGLGLTIVDQIVRQHGGYIEVTSHIRHGTSFVINIPLDPRKITSAVAPQDIPETSPRRAMSAYPFAPRAASARP